MADAAEKSEVTGQTVLPGMDGELGYESIKLKPKDEKFCWEYVLRAENGKKAMMAVKPGITERSAEVLASRLLRRVEVVARIKEIRAEMGRRLSATVLTYHRRVMEVEREDFLDANGRCKPIAEMSDDARAILEFEQVSAKDGVRTLLKVPTRHQSAVEIARITGMHKDNLKVDADIDVHHDGAVGVTDDIQKLDALRDRFKGVLNGKVDTAT